MIQKFINLPKSYRPSDKEEYMNDMQLEYFRRKLLRWKSNLTKESKDTIDHLKHKSLNSSDINDRASIEEDINFELKTRDRYRKLINKINAALIRIKIGSYGFCLKNFEPIGLKRLEARPVATLSIRAQEEHERIEKIYSDN